MPKQQRGGVYPTISRTPVDQKGAGTAMTESKLHRQVPQIQADGMSATFPGIRHTDGLADRFRLLFQHTRDIIIFTRSNGNILDANQAAIETYGYSRDELLQLSLFDLRPLQFRKWAQQILETIDEYGLCFETIHQRKDGGIFPVEVTAHVETIDGERVAMAIVRDITQRKRAEEVLRQREDKYRQLFESCTDGLLLLSESILDCNQKVCQMFGCPREEIIGKSPFDFSPATQPDGRQSEAVAPEYIQKALAGENQRFNWQHIRLDGTPIETQVTLQPIIIDGSTMLLVTLHDVTDRVRAMERIAYQANLLSQAGDALIGLDNTGIITYWNQSTERMCGFSADEVIGKPLLENFTFEWIGQDCTSEVTHNLATTGNWQGEVIYISPAGVRLYVDISMSAVKDGRGDVIGSIASLRDITARKEAEKALQEARNYLENLLENANAPIIVWDKDRRIIKANRALEQLSGRSVSDLIGKSTKELYSSRLHQEVDHQYQRLTRGQRLEGVVLPLQQPDGSERIIMWNAAPILDADGKTIIAGIAQGMDISDRILAEQEILRQTARAESLLHASSVLSRRLDLDIVLKTVCEETASALKVPLATVILYDPRHDMLMPAAVNDPAFEKAIMRIQPLPRSAFDASLETNAPVLVVPDLQTVEMFPSIEVLHEMHARSFMGVPLQHNDQLVGTLNVITVDETRQFTPDEMSLLRGLGDQAAQAIANARLFDEANRRLGFLQALRNVDRAITASMDLEVILDVLLGQVRGQLEVDAADVLLLDPFSQTLNYAAGQGFRSEALQHTHLRLGEGYAGRAARDRHLLHVNDLRADAEGLTASPFLATEHFVSYFAMPLIAKGQVKGVLELFHRTPVDPDSEWMSFLDALSRQAAIAIDNATLLEAQQRANIDLSLAYDTTLEGWSRALDLRDKETEGHSLRVTEYALRLAQALGIARSELIHIRRGALLHDIGKVGIPDSILLKPEKLTDEEWKIMRMHPVYGYQLLSPIEYLRPAIDIPYGHHEKWDGTGYPRGLKGTEIPIAARIFAIIDVWDALRSDRPYRSAWPKEKVRAHVTELAGTHFDPEVVRAFLQLVDNGDIQ